jgi:hypothetical protein
MGMRRRARPTGAVVGAGQHNRLGGGGVLRTFCFGSSLSCGGQQRLVG